jgi:hypothetical protein
VPCYPRAGSLPRLEPALRDELRVGGGDGVAGNAKVGGQGARRRKATAAGQPTRTHRLAESNLKLGTGATSGELDVQVDAGNGPRFWH